MTEKYPESRIVCGTLMRTCIKDHVADLSAQGLHYETLDGSHPTVAGHQTIANAWINYLVELGLIRGVDY